MLTPSEIELLRQSKREIAELYEALHAAKKIVPSIG